jgi:hypothetical protein
VIVLLPPIPPAAAVEAPPTPPVAAPVLAVALPPFPPTEMLSPPLAFWRMLLPLELVLPPPLLPSSALRRPPVTASSSASESGEIIGKWTISNFLQMSPEVRGRVCLGFRPLCEALKRHNLLLRRRFRPFYTTSLTAAQGEPLEFVGSTRTVRCRIHTNVKLSLGPASPGKARRRQASVNMREVVNGVMYVLSTGCQCATSRRTCRRQHGERLLLPVDFLPVVKHPISRFASFLADRDWLCLPDCGA